MRKKGDLGAELGQTNFRKVNGGKKSVREAKRNEFVLVILSGRAEIQAMKMKCLVLAQVSNTPDTWFGMKGFKGWWCEC